MTKTVYIIGSKGIPANYGGFETFVEKLTKHHKNKSIKYVVACMKENSLKSGIADDIFKHNGATCFNVDVPNVGPAKAIYYDIVALNKAISLARENRDIKPDFYVLACRIGPFISYFKRKIKALGGRLLVNPDGHEWLREKWSLPIRKYWKYSESLMVKYADLLVCDSKNIESYIHSEYAKYNPMTIYIAYGTELTKSALFSDDARVQQWFNDKSISEDNYYLVVGRFVPENNYASMLREFMKSDSEKDFVLITNVEQNKFYEKLRLETRFDRDKRIKFVGTVYDQELLTYIRENAFAYFHGHEVGGTNPSLLEALASTKLNLLLDVGFNREVAEDAAIYWRKDNLHKVINSVEKLEKDEIFRLKEKAFFRVSHDFSWGLIIDKYELLLRNNENSNEN